VSGGWIGALAPVETADAPAFERVPGQHVSDLDATSDAENHPIVALDTDEDEVWFRIAALDDATIGDIRPLGGRSYLAPVRLRGGVRRWIVEGLFEGAASLLTAVRLDLRGEGIFRRLDAALGAERAAFVRQRPRVWRCEPRAGRTPPGISPPMTPSGHQTRRLPPRRPRCATGP
jgi:hypothetical protein